MGDREKRENEGLEECERGGERGQLRKASSCAPSTLILSACLLGVYTELPTPPPLPIHCPVAIPSVHFIVRQAEKP